MKIIGSDSSRTPTTVFLLPDLPQRATIPNPFSFPIGLGTYAAILTKSQQILFINRFYPRNLIRPLSFGAPLPARGIIPSFYIAAIGAAFRDTEWL